MRCLHCRLAGWLPPCRSFWTASSNEVKGKWTATYPFRIPPSTLKDNFEQVYRYTLAQENRLAKPERTEEFNSEFYKSVERGVFREIGPKEMAAWSCLVNYISMVEAFKEGPPSTTPLRICMNSSLKQPRPVVSLSLNDCLMKGPSALVNLFTVTLCIREHRYALTKDLSKFYQRVDADPQPRTYDGSCGEGVTQRPR